MGLEGVVLDGLDLNSAASGSASAFQTAALALSPALYWRHGEPSGTTANDTSGNSRTGTYGAGITVNQTGLLTGDTDKAITSNGATNAIVTSSYNPFTGNLTVCGWDNISSLASARNLWGGTAATGPLFQVQTNGDANFWSDLGVGSAAWGIAGMFTAATTIFWTLTWNNTTKVAELFLNAVSKGTKSLTNAFNATPGNFVRNGSAAANGNIGTQDETLVYAATILSPAQITALYNAGSVASTSSAFILQGYEVPPPNKRVEWAQSSDLDGALLIRDPKCDNREITLRLRVRQQATMDLALAQIATLSNKLEEAEQQPDGLALVWTPHDATKTMTFYVLSGSIDGLPIELSGDNAGWFQRAPVITVKLVCKPFGYGTPVTSSTTSSATPIVTTTIAGLGGDVPAEGRLLVTDAATQNRKYIEWGLEWRYYDGTTSLLLDSDNLTLVGGTGTTRSGAYDPNASGNNVVRQTLFDVPTTIANTGNLSHVGSFRVKARVYVNTTAIRVRFTWQEGDGPYRSNYYATPPTAPGFVELDLGMVTIPPKTLGTQRWQGNIEAYTLGTAGTDAIDIDYLVFVPAGEGYGKARSGIATGVGTLVATDSFSSIVVGTALGTRVAPLGGTWTTAGATTDFTAQNPYSAQIVEQRSTNADTGIGRTAVLGVTNYAAVQASVDITWSGRKTTAQGGLILRWTSANQYLAIYMEQNTGLAASGPAQLVIRKTVPGPTTTELARSATFGGTYAATSTLAATVTAAGVATATVTIGGLVVASLSITDADLVTAGTLQTGLPGFFDYQPSGTAQNRGFDNFTIITPLADPIALYSGRTAEIRYDGVLRQDSTGTYYGPAPIYRGARFLVPPAGDENRTARILTKAHRNDIEISTSDNVTDNLTIQTIVTPRYMVVPF